MKQKKVWEACVLLMLGMQMVSGCKAGETAQTEKIHVGVTYYNQSDTFLNCVLLMLGMQMVSGCKAGETAQTEKIHVGVTYYNQSDTFLNEMLSNFREELKLAAGTSETTVTVLDAAGAQRTQDDQVKELIDMECDVLCVNLRN